MKTTKKIIITILFAGFALAPKYVHAITLRTPVVTDSESEEEPSEDIPPSDEIVVNQIKNMMKSPTKENIEACIQTFHTTNEKHKLNIFKHILCLSNLGNPDANAALEEIRPETTKENFPTVIYKEPDLEEEDRIISYNERLDAEYEDFIKQIWDKYFPDMPYMAVPHERATSISLPDGVRFPIRADLYYQCHNERFLWLEAIEDYSSIVLKGWKLHISAQPSSAKKIAEIAVPILEEMHIPYKICISLNALRHLNTTIAKGETQMGKFIAIYPKTNDDANRIATALDEAFTQAIDSGRLHPYDFCELLGDAQLGHSGALYVRYGAFQPTKVIKDKRTVPLYPQKSVPKISPFKDLPITFYYEHLPYDNCDSWIINTREIQRSLLINTLRVKHRLSFPPLSSWTKEDAMFLSLEKKTLKK